MAVNYPHDPEAVEVGNGVRLVKTVRSAVIGLADTTPVGDVSTLVQCLSEKGAAAFSSQLTGFTIPRALDAIYGYDTGTVLIINVLDPTKHKMAIEDEVATFDKSTGQARLARPVAANMVVKNSEGSTTHTANTDHRVGVQAGVLANLGRAIKAGDSVKMSYEYTDPLKVTTAGITGGVNSAGNRIGMKLLNDSFNLYDYLAKIPITPVFYTQESVTVKLIAMVEKLDAITYTDAPVSTTLAQALASRDPEGTISFNTSSDRVRLCYPHMKVYDPVINTERLEPFSQRVAGLRARVDLDKDYWWSSPNQKILGITGVERQLPTMIDDSQSEVNLLNE